MRRPVGADLDRTTCGTAESGEPHGDSTEKRGDRVLPVDHVANTSATWTIRPQNGVGWLVQRPSPVGGSPHFDTLLRHDAILSNTPSRRIRPWKRAAPKWARNVKKSK
jgi:hypothetical protein